MSNRYEKEIYLSLIAEQCERFDDMFRFMEKMAKGNQDELSRDERNLFYTACKNHISQERSSILSLLDYESKESKKANSFYLSYLKEYRNKYQKSLENKCNKIIELIDSKLIYKVSDEQGRVFYQKMKGDFYRYMAENADLETKKNYAEKCLNEYKEAMITGEKLLPNDSIKLGLILNYSLFCYEMMGNIDEAMKMCYSAIEEFQEGMIKAEQERLKKAAEMEGMKKTTTEQEEMKNIEGEEEEQQGINLDEEEENYMVDARNILKTMQNNLEVWEEEKKNGVIDEVNK